jgi:large subunit ribosomal protein L10
MTKQEKNQLIEELTQTLTTNSVIYLADASGLSAERTSHLRRTCFNKNIKLSVVKNTLLKKAFERVEGKDFSELYEVLSGPTAIMISDTGNAPAKLIKEFRNKEAKPQLKGAYVEEMCFVGDDQLQTLIDIKSREELIGEVIGLLQSPIRNVVGALQSGGHTIAGLVKTLSDR